MVRISPTVETLTFSATSLAQYMEKKKMLLFNSLDI